MKVYFSHLCLTSSGVHVQDNSLDSFVRLVFLMMRNNGDWQYKMKLLLTVKQVLHKEERRDEEDPVPPVLRRFFVILFQEVTAEPMAPEKLHKILQLFW